MYLSKSCNVLIRERHRQNNNAIKLQTQKPEKEVLHVYAQNGSISRLCDRRCAILLHDQL